MTLFLLPRLGTVVRTRRPGLHFLRSLFLLMATTAFFFAISRMGLAEATAIIDVNPVLITLGAALFLGEKFGPRRALGIGAALIGALIIIRPGSAVFSPTALLPLIAAVCFASFAITTRFLGRNENIWTSLFYTALLGAIVLSVLVIPVWVRPDGSGAAPDARDRLRLRHRAVPSDPGADAGRGLGRGAVFLCRASVCDALGDAVL